MCNCRCIFFLFYYFNSDKTICFKGMTLVSTLKKRSFIQNFLIKNICKSTEAQRLEIKLNAGVSCDGYLEEFERQNLLSS